ncbi:unnamed protein product, partial [Brachionus calyciflorus]
MCMESVTYLGYRISNEGLKPDHGKTRAIAELKAPSNKEEVKRSLGRKYFKAGDVFASEVGRNISMLVEIVTAEQASDAEVFP